MDDKEKDFMPEGVDKEKDALLADEIPLDEHPDFVDEPVETVEPRAEETSTLLSVSEEKDNSPEPEEEVKEEEKDMEEKEETTNVVDDDTPVIDESETAVPGAEEMNEALKPKLKETSVKKKKRILIAVVSAVVIVAIVLAIALPIYFVNKDKIFVKSAEDFMNYDEGKYFVLDKDVTVDGDLTISRAYNIDLNGHSLVVTGTLKYDEGADTEKTIYIGTKKGDSYIAKGLLQAGTIEFATPCANVILASSVTVGTMNINANEFTLSSSAQANGTVTVKAAKANIKGAIAFGEGENAKFVADNVAALSVNANISSAVELKYSTMTIAKNATVGSVALDPSSRAAVYGKVTDGITTLSETEETPEVPEGDGTTDENEGAETLADEPALNNIVVLIGTEFSCPTVSGINTVAIERRSGLSVDLYNCATVKYIDRLAAPVDINIDERADGSLVAVSSKVQNAQGYAFRIDGKEWIDMETNEFDITAQLTSQTGTHRIEVYAKGNYSYDDPFALGESSTLYLNGETTACEYTYRIQLATPSNLNVTVSTVEGKQVYTLTFDKVAFATAYEYYVNGTKYVFSPEGDDSLVSIDITDKLTAAGAYAIRVVATADSADILTSKAAMTSAIKIDKLLTPTLSATMQEDGRTLLTISTTEGVSTTYLVTYEATMQDGSRQSVTLVTTNSSVYLEGLAEGDSITVTAQASGYYTESDPSTVTVSAQTPVVPEQ